MAERTAERAVEPPAGTAPPLGRRVLESLITAKYPGRYGDRLLLVHGRYEPGAPAEFTARVGEGEHSRRIAVRASEQHSVLGIAEAWHRHREADPRGDSLLLIVTTLADADIGWDVRGHAINNRVYDVNQAEIVQQRFGAGQLDARLYAEPWLATALLHAEPPAGWQQTGGLLTWDRAMGALVSAVLGFDRGGPESVPDADALLAWSRTPGGPARFAALGPEEREGITAWLSMTAGPAARPLLELAAAGRGKDAMALGVVGAVIDEPAGPAAAAETGMALGALFGRLPDTVTANLKANLRALAGAAHGTLARWLSDGSGPSARHLHADTTPRQRALEVLRRADELAAEAGLTAALAGSLYLPSAFDARLRAVAFALDRPAAEADWALTRLKEHRLAPVLTGRVRTAEAAVRLTRRLARPHPLPVSVADAVRTHLADWAWVDSALSVLWAGDPAADGAVAAAYASLCENVRHKRAEVDAAFAERLTGWARTASHVAPGGCLLVEDVLAQVAAPLQRRGAAPVAPLILVLDGMSGAAAVELAAGIAGRGGFTEVSHDPERPGRAAAVAAIPSLTRISRAALLSAELTEGGQGVEKAGFAGFWAQRRDRGAALFHKADIAGTAGRRLSAGLAEALAGGSAVGVVLNTIDDSLDHAAQGDRTGWNLADITYLDELLDAARSYGRPVVLVSDHGHVLERGVSEPAVPASDEAGSARWRTGRAGDGEVEISGPRVREGGGEVVVPWREDIRYAQRKGGYHGGVSLAEMAVPVLVFLPSLDLLPKGWSALAPESVTPDWWEPHSGASGTSSDSAAQRTAEEAAGATGRALSFEPAAKPARSRARRSSDEPGPALFPLPTEEEDPQTAPAREPRPVEAAPPAQTLGRRIVDSEVFAAQRQYVRRGPKTEQVVAAVDALVRVEGTLSVTALAEAAGFASARAAGLTAMLQRLLNVEGYPVLEYIDGGARLRLNADLARRQFGAGNGA